MLIDDILVRVKKEEGKEQSEMLRKLVADATYLKIQNVADYYWGSSETFTEAISFPNCTPPWQSCWMEWQMPKTIRIKNDVRQYPHSGPLAALVLTKENR